MATKTESTRALTGPRILTQTVPSYSGTFQVAGGGGTSVAEEMNGWQALGARTFTYETYFDLGAYELDDLTFVPSGITVQDPGPILQNGGTLGTGAATPSLWVWDIISQERLDLNIFNDGTVTNPTGAQNAPSMPNTNIDWNQILYGNFKLYSTQTTNQLGIGTLLQLMQSQPFGSASPTTAQKLWVYRVCQYYDGLVNIQGQPLDIPSARFILGGTVVKEDDLSYMMRQKRSYELAKN